MSIGKKSIINTRYIRRIRVTNSNQIYIYYANCDEYTVITYKDERSLIRDYNKIKWAFRFKTAIELDLN